MNISDYNDHRKKINALMSESDEFFKQFAHLDDTVYYDGAIPKKYKELTGLSISVLTRCEECVLYHLQGCIAANANKMEIIEAIKNGVIGCGSITYPIARFTFKILKDLKVFE